MSRLYEILTNPEQPLKTRSRAWQKLPAEERRLLLVARAMRHMGPGKESVLGCGSVYFIQEPSTKAIKIGVTNDIEGRLGRLQTSHPYKLSVLATCPGGLKLEKALHIEFAADRLEGEWFKSSDRLLAKIRELTGAVPTSADTEDNIGV